MAWLMLPFFVAFVFPRFGIRLPGFVLTVNAWLLASGPLGLLLKIGGGVTASSGLIDAVAWMSELQLLGGVLFLVWAIVRLRSAYRINVSDESRSLVGRLTRPGWRLRAKPAVSDDPILWREMTTSRVGFLSWAFSAILISCIYGALGYVTFFFGRPAFIELWHHGYTAGLTTAERPEMNLMVRFFMPDYGVKPPADIARTEFNLFLRWDRDDDVLDRDGGGSRRRHGDRRRAVRKPGTVSSPRRSPHARFCGARCWRPSGRCAGS